MSAPSKTSMPPVVVALAGWLLPGGGYLLIGQRPRALVVGITILSLFVLGLLIGGVRVVEASKISYRQTPMRAIMDRPWFVPQILAGPITPIVAAIGRNEWFMSSHARLNEIGTLYTAIAGMLNLMVIVDAAWRSGRKSEPG
jgi:hypothetical protein